MPKARRKIPSDWPTCQDTSTICEGDTNAPPTEEMKIQTDNLHINVTLSKEFDQIEGSDRTSIHSSELNFTAASSQVQGSSEEATSLNLGRKSLKTSENLQTATEIFLTTDPLEFVTCEYNQHGDSIQIADNTQSSEFATISAIPELDENSSNSNHFKEDMGKQELLSRHYTHDVSDKMSRFKSNLMRHDRRCLVGKTFRCSICGQTFHRELDLVSHERKHTVAVGFSSHNCDFCSKRFITKSYLKRHALIHTGESSYMCDFCAKSFSTKSILKTHKMIHTGEKPFKCVFCGTVFTRKWDLKIHTMIHTGEKPYKCEVCGKTFNRKNDLNRHATMHTGMKLHKCNVCGKMFTRESNLNHHKLLHPEEKS